MSSHSRPVDRLVIIARLLATLTALCPLATVAVAGWFAAVTRLGHPDLVGTVLALFALVGWYLAFCYAVALIGSAGRTGRAARLATVIGLQDGSRARGVVIGDAILIVIGTTALVVECLLAWSAGPATDWLSFLGIGMALQLGWAAMSLHLVVRGLCGDHRQRRRPAATA